MADSIPPSQDKKTIQLLKKKKKSEILLEEYITYMSLSKVICPILKVFCTSWYGRVYGPRLSCLITLKEILIRRV